MDLLLIFLLVPLSGVIAAIYLAVRLAQRRRR